MCRRTNNTLSWGELFNPKYRGRVALFGIDWLGMLDAALGMKALGLLPAETDPTGLTNKEVDTVVAFLKEKKKEGHFRALWRAYGELVNLMAAQEVWIADAWWPVVVEVAGKRHPGALRRGEGRLSRLVRRPGDQRELPRPRPGLSVAELLDGGLPRRPAVGDRLLLHRGYLPPVPRARADHAPSTRGRGATAARSPTGRPRSMSGTRGRRTWTTIPRSGTSSLRPDPGARGRRRGVFVPRPGGWTGRPALGE